MDVKELFTGIAIIVDDEINNRETPIYKIKEYLIKNNIPVVCFDKLPEKNIIDSFGDASFIIIDWDLNNKMVPGEELSNASALKDFELQEVIDFIKEVLDKLFLPVFIFSGKGIGEIKGILSAENLYNDDHSDRLFVKTKDELLSEENLFSSIEGWLKDMPSVYVLKMIEGNIRNTKNKMFTEWYKYSPSWTSVIWQMLKEDSIDGDQDFGEFLVKNLVNRMEPFEFDEFLFDNESNVDKDELRKVLEYERYIEYGSNQPMQAYTGDLFKEDGKYFVNIRAQCDLSRANTKVELYLIEGKEIDQNSVLMNDIKLTKDKKLVFSGGNYKLSELDNYCEKAGNGDESDLDKINKAFAAYKDSLFFQNGEILEKKTEAVIACIDKGKIIKFDLRKIRIKKFKDLERNRIGRILPPYITRIQQKFSQYITREGTPPLPKELFIDN